MATKTFNVALDATLLAEVDSAVRQDLGSRSEYFRRLALADLRERKLRAQQDNQQDVWETLAEAVAETEDAAAAAGYVSEADYARLAKKIQTRRSSAG